MRPQPPARNAAPVAAPVTSFQSYTGFCPKRPWPSAKQASTCAAAVRSGLTARIGTAKAAITNGRKAKHDSSPFRHGYPMEQPHPMQLFAFKSGDAMVTIRRVNIAKVRKTAPSRNRP